MTTRRLRNSVGGFLKGSFGRASHGLPRPPGLLLACLMVTSLVLNRGNADAQDASLAEAQQPASRITVYASGGADFTPINPPGENAPASPPASRSASVGATVNPATGQAAFTVNPSNSAPAPSSGQAPSCAAKYTEVGLRVSCENGSGSGLADVCRGSMNFYQLNVSEEVEGGVKSNPDGSFTMTLHSTGPAIEECVLNNVPPVAAEGANALQMQCNVTLKNCKGLLAGSGADHAVAENALITLAPAD